MTSPVALDSDRCWDAVCRRDRGFDGRFVTGVLTTGIYCRPSCPARHPARRNLRFFIDAAAAQAAGLRPCKRCLPDDVARDEQAVARAIALLSGEAPPRLSALAAAVGYSPSHFSRLFERQTGLTPAAWLRDLKGQRARAALADGASVTDAIYAGGFSGPSRFYAQMKGELGMTPSAWARGGAGVTIDYRVIDTPLGAMMIAASEQGVCRLTFGDDVARLRRDFPKATLREDLGGRLAEWAEAAVRAVAGDGDAARTVPLDLGGTAFQQKVWAALCAIPPGETRSYADIATAAGNPGATRAAGSANGANPVAVLVPCHRVIRSDGSIGGYAWGPDVKRRLLEAEGALRPDTASGAPLLDRIAARG